MGQRTLFDARLAAQRFPRAISGYRITDHLEIAERIGRDQFDPRLWIDLAEQVQDFGRHRHRQGRHRDDPQGPAAVVIDPPRRRLQAAEGIGHLLHAS
ncbi:hypothetical protein [Tistrella arctica]|uniref:hypothetical protein n=1 Tax=Tistrella arctica TaxID=3133430 RepID=UPI0031F5F23A